jgi:penicillin-binding protein-related factor A (putative recombinase)
MPVPFGIGASTLDYVLCVNGHFVAIEAKTAGKKPTERQSAIIQQITRAGGKVFVIDGTANTDTLASLERYLDVITRFQEVA